MTPTIITTTSKQEPSPFTHHRISLQNYSLTSPHLALPHPKPTANPPPNHQDKPTQGRKPYTLCISAPLLNLNFSKTFASIPHTSLPSLLLAHPPHYPHIRLNLVARRTNHKDRYISPGIPIDKPKATKKKGKRDIYGKNRRTGRINSHPNQEYNPTLTPTPSPQSIPTRHQIHVQTNIYRQYPRPRPRLRSQRRATQKIPFSKQILSYEIGVTVKRCKNPQTTSPLHFLYNSHTLVVLLIISPILLPLIVSITTTD